MVWFLHTVKLLQTPACQTLENAEKLQMQFLMGLEKRSKNAYSIAVLGINKTYGTFKAYIDVPKEHFTILF